MNKMISNFQQIASVRHYTLLDGAEKGVEVLDCDNGKIRFLLNVSKALDIMQLYQNGQNISFISKNSFKLNNSGFSKRFEGGMVYTCGLDNVGNREGYELHGTFHNLHADIIKKQCDENGIIIEAIIKDTELFGKNLVLHRKISSQIGSNSVQLEDELINNGYSDEDYCLLYHINVGYPFLDDESQIEAKINNIVPRTDWAKSNQNNLLNATYPEDKQEEMCYFLKLEEPKISIINKKSNREFTLTFSKETLPYFIEWKSMASGDYAIGLEPSTTELDDKFQYKKIKKDENISFKIIITIN